MEEGGQGALPNATAIGACSNDAVGHQDFQVVDNGVGQALHEGNPVRHGRIAVVDAEVRTHIDHAVAVGLDGDAVGGDIGQAAAAVVPRATRVEGLVDFGPCVVAGFANPHVVLVRGVHCDAGDDGARTDVGGDPGPGLAAVVAVEETLVDAHVEDVGVAHGFGDAVDVAGTLNVVGARCGKASPGVGGFPQLGKARVEGVGIDSAR